MDPFQSVLKDAQTKLGSAQLLLRQYRANPDPAKLADLHNTIQDLSEVIRELSGSIAAVQMRPEQFGLTSLEVEQRIEQVGQINNQVTDIQEALAGIRSDTRERARSLTSQAPLENLDQVPDVNDEDRQMLFQTTLKEQDSILGEVEQTVASLRDQANAMTHELDDQAIMIDDFENQVDLSNDRVRRGMNRVNYVLRNNRECMSNCCIILLSVALIILLVLVLIA